MEHISKLIKKGNNQKAVNSGKMKTIEKELTIDIKNAFMISAKTILPDFVVTPELVKPLNDICTYFLGLEGNLSLNKGLYLMGEYGVGKSTLMMCFRQWLADWWPFNGNGFSITSVEEIIERYKNENNLTKFIYVESNGFESPKHLLINEFGKKIDEKIYGTEASQIVNNLMMIRYDLFQRRGLLTHITSNTLPYSTEKALTDRYIEMFNLIEIGGKSFRK
jgi:DNA replication protein DnaC